MASHAAPRTPNALLPTTTTLPPPATLCRHHHTDTTLDTMAAQICSAGGAVNAHGWNTAATGAATAAASWAACSHTSDARVHAWASPHEQSQHWPQHAEQTSAVACPRPCQHVAAEILGDGGELPGDSKWICAMDEAELQTSVDLYLPEESFMTDLNGTSDCIPRPNITDEDETSKPPSAVGVGSLPTASFSLLGALSLLQPRSKPQPAPPVQRRRKAVSIGEYSVVRVFDKAVLGPDETVPTGRCCGDEAREQAQGITRGDICSPTHTEDGPRAENLLLDRLIVTHFEGWALTNPGAIAEFVGGDELLRQVGPGLVDRLEEMIASLDSGTVHHVGLLPSCVRMGLNHLPHLRTLHSWMVTGVQFVSGEPDEPPMVGDCEGEGEGEGENMDAAMSMRGSSTLDSNENQDAECAVGTVATEDEFDMVWQ